MQVTMTLPDEITQEWGQGAEIPRHILEAVVLQRYLAEEISAGRVAELLGLSRFETETFLDHNNARLPYTRQMLDEDRLNLTKIFGNR
jgi:predicted HTH domain antitoxin